METNKRRARTLWMVRTAILTAIIILMAFTPVGYIKTAGLEITLIMIPVTVGAILMGPGTGALLGTVFGITSFIQCFGFSAFGATLLGINPVYTFILTIVPRVLMGWLVGLIFQALHRIDKTKFISFAVASLSGAVLNTVLFIGGLFLLFGNTEFIRGWGPTWPAIFAIIAGTNALLEAAISLVAGTAVTKALYRIFKT
ncbi:MAG: ECF transporter S component [Saccharofermentanales bacterium]|jgi:uncharacterized membrane protein|nr:ECF transporter S component [Clostridiaceae bacterium]